MSRIYQPRIAKIVIPIIFSIVGVGALAVAAEPEPLRTYERYTLIEFTNLDKIQVTLLDHYGAEHSVTIMGACDYWVENVVVGTELVSEYRVADFINVNGQHVKFEIPVKSDIKRQLCDSNYEDNV